MDLPKTKYQIGQIVVLKTVKNHPPFRILSTKWEDGWFYQWNKNNYASEGMLRELTPEEKGCIPPVSEKKHVSPFGPEIESVLSRWVYPDGSPFTLEK